jgi:hypothetical protein
MVESEFDECEKTIDKGKRAFIEVGKALTEIRDRKGYRFKYGTFEEYCQKRWGWSVRTGYNMIAASKTAENIQQDTENVQAFAHFDYSKAVLLSTLPPEKQEEFVRGHDVFQMTFRELQSAIKSSKVAEQRAQVAEQQAKLEAEKVANLMLKVNDLTEILDKASEPEIIEIEKEVIPEKVQQQLADAERLITEKEGLEIVNQQLKFELELAQEQANQEPKIVEVIPEDYDRLKETVATQKEMIEKQSNELDHLTSAQKDLKYVHKLRSSVTLFVNDVGKRANQLMLEYQTPSLRNGEANQDMESCAVILEKTAQEIRNLIRAEVVDLYEL